jgi:adhesin/invasin
MKSDGVTLAQPDTPASIGETVVIYCAGLGAVSPVVKEGLPESATLPLSTTVNPVTVTIAGKAAQVVFSGLTPGYAGLYQVNAVVPSGIATGDAVPVVVSVAGQDSPSVAIAVR